MEFLFLILAVAGIAFAVLTTARVRRLEERFENFSDRFDVIENGADRTARDAVAPSPTVRAPSALAPASRKTARVVGLESTPEATRVGPIISEPSPRKEPIVATMPEEDIPQRPLSVRIEDLIGGKLPIWIGGLALVLAAFFLVRYSIEQGLLGPTVRSAIAAMFGLALIGASEAARRIERFASDPRVGQALAGAGVASLYGTLYMAGQLYGIISPLVGFVMMALVTGGALALSIRHGPPTAIMGLIGGFTAPFLSAPSGNLVPLLVYLGLLVAGLFAVAIHRGWTWLALAATGGSLVWSLGLMAADLTGIGPSLGLFIMLIALGATILLPRTGSRDPRIRLLPMLAGFIQLAIFAPAIEFGLSSWLLYGLLSGAGLFLGWRDAKLMPASIAALGLVLILLFAGFDQGKSLTIWPRLARLSSLRFRGMCLRVAPEPTNIGPCLRSAAALAQPLSPALHKSHCSPIGNGAGSSSQVASLRRG